MNGHQVPDGRARTTAPLGRLERVAGGVIGALALCIAVAGFVVSFDAVSAAVEPFFGELAPLVPLSVDLGILVFSALHLLLTRLDMAMPALRLVPWGLTAATVWLNLEAATSDPLDALAHVVMAGLWVVFIEVVTHAVKVRAGLVSGKRMERIRRSRWLLAPLSTVVLWRRMVLWEVTDYRTALGMERDRLLARTALQETYGWTWRWSAPLADRVRLRLGMLTAPEPVRSLEPAPEPVQAEADRALGPEPEPVRSLEPAREPVQVETDRSADPEPVRSGEPAPEPVRSVKPVRSAGVERSAGPVRELPVRLVREDTRTGPVAGPAVAGPDVSDLLEPGRAVRAVLVREGRWPSRRELAARLRAEGHTVSTDRARALMEALASADATDPVEAGAGLAAVGGGRDGLA